MLDLDMSDAMYGIGEPKQGDAHEVMTRVNMHI